MFSMLRSQLPLCIEVSQFDPIVKEVKNLLNSTWLIGKYNKNLSWSDSFQKIFFFGGKLFPERLLCAINNRYLTIILSHHEMDRVNLVTQLMIIGFSAENRMENVEERDMTWIVDQSTHSFLVWWMGWIINHTS